MRLFRSSLVMSLSLVFAAAALASDPIPQGIDEALAAAVAGANHDAVRQVGTPIDGLPEAWSLSNGARGVTGLFGAEGFHVVPFGAAAGDWRLSLALVEWGREGRRAKVRDAKLFVEGACVEYRRGELVEWYLNHEGGLEQGFTIDVRPDGEGAIELFLELKTELTAQLDADRRGISFRDAAGETVVRYEGLVSRDADGRLLACELVLEGSALTIRVEDAGAAYPITIDPICYAEQATLHASDAVLGDQLGYSVAISGDTVIVGAPAQVYSGTAYIFVRSGSSWSQQAKLLGASDCPGCLAGFSVDIDGDRAIVGAPEDAFGGSDPIGAAYLFERSGTTWSQVTRLELSTAFGFEYFGVAVALEGDWAAVSSLWGDGTHFYEEVGGSWILRQVTSLRSFSLAMSGNTLLIGDEPQAYVYVRQGSNWWQQAVLSSGESGDRFGDHVALQGDTALVGASHDDDLATDAGAAHVFTRTGGVWTHQAELHPPVGATNERFGQAVALAGSTAVVGSFLGVAHLFEDSGAGWLPGVILGADQPGVLSVAAEGETILAGLPFDGGGAVRVFVPSPRVGVVECTCTAGPCSNLDPSAGCANSTGRGAQLTAQGFVPTGEVNLLLFHAPPGQFGIFFQGANLVALPFGDGLLCTNQSLIRITPIARKTAGDGSAAFGPCFGDPSIPDVTGVVPGSGVIRRYQFYYRDPAGPCGSGFNTSNALAIPW